MPNSTKKKTQKHKRVQESTPMEPFEQLQKKQQHTHGPSLQVAIPDITSVAEGQTFPVNKVEEVIQHVKQQAKAQNVQASVGKGSSILSRSPVLYMVCSRAGYSAKNAAILNGKEYISKPKKSGSASDGSKTDTGISKPLQRRKSSSYKCGCEWKISFSFSRLDVGLMCRVTAVALQHTNGCNPSPLQYSIAKRRVGDGFMEIPKPLAVTLHIIFRGKRYHNTTVRELLREHGVVKRDEVITGMMIANLRAKLLTLDADHTKWKEDDFCVPKNIDELTSEVEIEKFAAEYIKQQLNEDGGASVVDLFLKLKEEYEGFEFRIARSSQQDLTAWMFMTPEMQFMAAKYAQIVFLDAIKSKISAVDWPFYPIAVIDEENKLYIVAFCLCIQESNEAYKWILDSMKSVVPSLQHTIKVTMSVQAG